MEGSWLGSSGEDGQVKTAHIVTTKQQVFPASQVRSGNTNTKQYILGELWALENALHYLHYITMHYSLNALQVSLNKSVWLMHKCKCREKQVKYNTVQ